VRCLATAADADSSKLRRERHSGRRAGRSEQLSDDIVAVIGGCPGDWASFGVDACGASVADATRMPLTSAMQSWSQIFGAARIPERFTSRLGRTRWPYTLPVTGKCMPLPPRQPRNSVSPYPIPFYIPPSPGKKILELITLVDGF